MSRIQQLLVIALMGTALTACNKGGNDESTHTVKELLLNKPLYDKISVACRNNPAEMALKPNCVNSRQVDYYFMIDNCYFYKTVSEQQSCLNKTISNAHLE